MLLLISSTLFFSCKKFVQTSPPEYALTGKTVFTSDAQADAAMVSIYQQMSSAFQE